MRPLMLRILIVAVLLVTVGLTAAPGVAAAPDKECFGVYDCEGLIGVIKRQVEELDPRDWPCTCDPQPEPW